MIQEIRSVRIFNGKDFSEPKSVIWENDRFGKTMSTNNVIDGKGLFLIPGLIDSHIHLSCKKNLEDAAIHGVTGLIDMATQDPSVVNDLRNLNGLPVIKSSYRAASEAGSRHAIKMNTPMIGSVSEAKAFVNEQIGFGADHIKIVLPNKPKDTGFEFSTLRALVDSAHEHNRKVVAHAVTTPAYDFALGSGIDVITHLPLNNCIEYSVAEQLAREEVVCVPTLVMMKGMSQKLKLITRGRINYKNSCKSFNVLNDAGVRFLAGTDANDDKKSPYQPKFGSSLIEELGLMQDLGLSSVKLLEISTKAPAGYWDLEGFGTIEPGKLANFSLISKNPLENIRNLKKIQQVWISGKQIH